MWKRTRGQAISCGECTPGRDAFAQRRLYLLVVLIVFVFFVFFLLRYFPLLLQVFVLLVLLVLLFLWFFPPVFGWIILTPVFKFLMNSNILTNCRTLHYKFSAPLGLNVQCGSTNGKWSIRARPNRAMPHRFPTVSAATI